MIKKILLLAAILLLFSSFPAAAEDEPADASFRGLLGWKWELNPADQPYPHYLADPRRPRMHIGVGIYDSQIPRTTALRWNVDLGTRFTLFKISDPKDVNEFALDVEGCLFNQFDLGHATDSIGWDGRYGAYIVYDWSDTIATRIGFRHISSHIGDEYIEATGRSRVNYTRNDLRLGISFSFQEYVTAYVEPSWAFHRGNEDRQEKLAIEGGIQFEGPYTMWNNSTAFFTGVHVASYQETGWRPGVSFQIGYHIKRAKKANDIRVALEAYAGRSELGEFALDYNERYVSLGVFFDFY